MTIPIVPFPWHMFENRQVKIIGLDDPHGTERCYWCGKVIEKQNKDEIEKHMHESCQKEQKNSNLLMLFMFIMIIFLLCLIPIYGYLEG